MWGMQKALTLIAGLLVVGSVTIAAQWPKFTDPSVPRTPQGGVRYNAPAPRTADGKIDFTGIWMRAESGPPRRGRGARAGGAAAAPRHPAAPAAPAAGAARQGGVPGGDTGAAFRGRTRQCVARAVHRRAFPTTRAARPWPPSSRRGGNIEGGLPYTPWAREIRARAVRGQQGQGQPRCDVHADGVPAVPPAAAAAQDHPDRSSSC